MSDTAPDPGLLDRLRRVADSLDVAGTGFDPATIQTADNWNAWRHQDMVVMLDQVLAGVGGSPGQEWSTIGARITEDFTTFDRELTAALGAGWQGAAAETAAGATTPIAAWGQALGVVTAVTGLRMLSADLAARDARANLPEPRGFDWKRALLAPVPETDLFAQHAEQENAKAEAVRVMDTYLTAGYRDADGTVPAFPEPPGLVQGSAPVHYGPGGSYAGVPEPGASYPMWTGLGIPVPVPDQSPQATGAGPVAPAAPAATSPAALAPVAPQAPAAPVVPFSQEVTTQTSAASVFGPGPGTGPGGGAHAAPGAAPTAPREAPGSGAAVGSTRGPAQPGLTQSFARPLAETPRPAAAAGGAGMGPAGMPMGGGASGRGDDDAEHRSRYTVDDDKNNLFSHGLSAVTPVIGETQ
ncbi:hypothetical protein ACOBQX_20315 [Actinokineospora sp. G85]|uniref:hypothetical protein n=1 Tax=Actinokineospora sp. G85 TaxID=3406626 RepID=UPI003C71B26D